MADALQAHSMDDLMEMSDILNTGLDRETLRVLVALCEAGVHPEALAAVVKELRREAADIAAEEEAGRLLAEAEQEAA